MIVDLESFAADATMEADVCVIGSGAAGLAIANELVHSPLRTVILESGGEDDDAATQALYDTESTGAPFPTAQTGRFRIFGGSTTRWGGQALPLTPLDFEVRDWVAHSGWPVTYAELEPFYARASEFLLVDRLDYDRGLLGALGAQPPRFDPEVLHYHLSKWSPTPNTREIYRDAIAGAERLTLVLHANVTRLAFAEDGERVERVEARTLGGRRIAVRASQVVIAGGGIESARLLLANRDRHPAGIGNAHDQVGRYFQDHPAAVAGYLHPRSEHDVQRAFNQFHRDGRKYAVRCSAAPAFQSRERILNATVSVFFEIGEDSPYERLRGAFHLLKARRLGGDLTKRLLQCAMEAPALARPVWNYYVKHRTWTPGARFRVTLNTEQEPNPSSRITLSSRTDALGMPLASIHWELTEASARTCRVFARAVERELARTGLGRLELEPWLRTDDGPWRDRLADQNHHMGTTRMSVSPRDGVVDPNLRVHGTTNLHVASSSVFPTGGHSNPTLTLIALAIRLADRFQRR